MNRRFDVVVWAVVVICVVGFGAAPAAAQTGGPETGAPGPVERGASPAVGGADAGPVTGAPDCRSVSYRTDGGTKLVENVQQLQCMSQDLDGDYRLVADVDASGTAQWNGTVGFDPIEPFTGTFDGNGHAIAGLAMKQGDEYGVGLFGSIGGVGESATVEDVVLENVDIRGGNGVAGLVGASTNSTVVDAHVVAGQVNGGSAVGGVVGNARKTDIRRSHAEVRVHGPQFGSGAGGLVGRADESVITRSYATGQVTASGGNRVGGLVGDLQSSRLNHSYATGSVKSIGSITSSGSEMVGGLVGLNNASVVYETYATGDVGGAKHVGGLVGKLQGEWAEIRVISDTDDDLDYDVTNAPLYHGEVYDSYARGDVYGTGLQDVGVKIGGLVGSAAQSSIVRRSYATGDVDANDPSVTSRGALIGYIGPFNFFDDRAVLQTLYEDTESGPAAPIGERANARRVELASVDVIHPLVQNVTYLATGDMQGGAAASEMSGFGFGSTWSTVTGPDGYPTLANVVEGKTDARPYFQLSNVFISRFNDTNVDIDVDVDNTGGSADTQALELRVDTDGSGTLDADETLASKSVQVDGGRFDAVTIDNAPITSVPPGTYTYGVVSENDTITGTLIVDPLEELDVSVEPSTVRAGQSTTVRVEVYEKNGGPVDNAAIEVPALGLSATTGPVGTAEVTVDTSAAGDHRVTVSADGYVDEEETLTVTGGNGGGHPSGLPQPKFSAVAGNDGILDRPDVLVAVGAYVNGRRVDGFSLSRAEVLDLIAYYVRQ